MIVFLGYVTNGQQRKLGLNLRLR